MVRPMVKADIRGIFVAKSARGLDGADETAELASGYTRVVVTCCHVNVVCKSKVEVTCCHVNESKVGVGDWSVATGRGLVARAFVVEVAKLVALTLVVWATI